MFEYRPVAGDLLVKRNSDTTGRGNTEKTPLKCVIRGCFFRDRANGYCYREMTNAMCSLITQLVIECEGNEHQFLRANTISGHRARCTSRGRNEVCFSWPFCCSTGNLDKGKKVAE